jgi:hypothetical protein
MLFFLIRNTISEKKWMPVAMTIYPFIARRKIGESISLIIKSSDSLFGTAVKKYSKVKNNAVQTKIKNIS